MIESKLDIQIKYNETCNSLRMYSIQVMNIRNLSIVQGLIVLSASGIILNDNLDLILM